MKNNNKTQKNNNNEETNINNLVPSVLFSNFMYTFVIHDKNHIDYAPIDLIGLGLQNLDRAIEAMNDRVKADEMLDDMIKLLIEKKSSLNSDGE